MKNLLIIAGIFLLASCEMPKPPQPMKLKLVAKKEAIGSHYNILTKKQAMDTEYFLIFENGSYEKVDLGKYMLAKEGTYYNVPNYIATGQNK